jgi:hypothetical protein
MVRVDPDAIAEVFARRGIMLDEMDIITEVWRHHADVLSRRVLHLDRRRSLARAPAMAAMKLTVAALRAGAGSACGSTASRHANAAASRSRSRSLARNAARVDAARLPPANATRIFGTSAGGSRAPTPVASISSTAPAKSAPPRSPRLPIPGVCCVAIGSAPSSIGTAASAHDTAAMPSISRRPATGLTRHTPRS